MLLLELLGELAAAHNVNYYIPIEWGLRIPDSTSWAAAGQTDEGSFFPFKEKILFSLTVIYDCMGSGLTPQLLAHLSKCLYTMTI